MNCFIIEVIENDVRVRCGKLDVRKFHEQIGKIDLSFKKKKYVLFLSSMPIT